MAKLEKDVKEVQNKVTDIQTMQETTDGVVAELQTSVTEVKKSVTENSATIQNEILAEIKDREERKHNIVIHGIPESAKAEKEEIQAEEDESLKKMFLE